MNDKYRNKKEKHQTKYGEFIPTYFGWMSRDEQKEKADELDKMTKKK